jgi:hypothetical protein
MTVTAVSAQRVQSAIALAASRTGIDFDYLLGQAKLESGLNAGARARTSTASGLYQFIEQSWLAVVKSHGAEHGLGWAADSIGRSGGRLTVSDPATRQAILDLRNDPAAASLMAAEHASDNKAALEQTLGRDATGTDLYMAHFLGLGGAKQFLRTMAANPQANGAALFPAAARANRPIFFEADGSPRSLSAIYSRFAARLERGAAGASGTLPDVQYAAQALDLDGATVVTGSGESATDALAWARSLNRGPAAATPMRPTPDTARLAYMMLASMGA